MANQRRLDQFLAKYMNAPATKNEINAALKQYSSLVETQEKFAFNDGSAKDLVKLQGTIPIVYKNNTYNIPICIWLMDTHPNNAPICFVQPTSEMGIRVSMYVDCNGKIYLPYLHEWSPGSSDLVTLIQILIVTFGEMPPVFKSASVKLAYAPSPYMPLPPMAGGSAAGGPSTGYMAPYPPAGGQGVPATYMPYPSAGGGGMMAPTSNFPPYPMAAAGGYPHPMPGQQQPGQGAPYPVGNGGGITGNGYNAGTGTITEEHIKVSLISAVEDKLRRRIQERVNQAQAEIETLQRVKSELQEGGAKIDERLARMEREQADMRANIAVLQDKKATVEKSLADADKVSGAEFNVDDAVTTTAPLYKQLLNAYAEEAATEDANYYLGEALRNGVIDLEVFLKHVRQLSRKQFQLRALMQKCRQTAGLAC